MITDTVIKNKIIQIVETTKRVHMLVRSGGLADSMSCYLIRRIEESHNIVLRTHTKIVGVEESPWYCFYNV
jgi:thioredoxin reductase